MKEKLSHTLIIFLGVVASFVFYGTWHTESKSLEKSDQISKASAPKKKNALIQEEVNKEKIHAYISEISVDKNISINEFQKEIKKADFTYDTVEVMKIDTQEIYDSLQPEDYDESIARANEVFEAIDVQVQHVNKELQHHMEIALPSKNLTEIYMPQIDESNEIELPIVDE